MQSKNFVSYLPCYFHKVPENQPLTGSPTQMFVPAMQLVVHSSLQIVSILSLSSLVTAISVSHSVWSGSIKGGVTGAIKQINIFYKQDSSHITKIRFCH